MDAGAVRPPLEVIDPLARPEWDCWLTEFPEATFFHGSAWARVLHETYGHRPLYFCQFDQARLNAVLPVMELSSPWAGRRGVSLPFTDVCPPLVSARASAAPLYQAAFACGNHRRWRSLDCRSNNPPEPGASPSLSFHGHVLQFDGGPAGVFKNFASAVRRGIRKAEASGLRLEFSTSLESVRVYYQLHCRTRRRHGLPPQPFRFFANLARFALARDLGFVALARLRERPVAGAVFLRFGRHACYKFGASDYDFQQLRPNNLVMWQAIEHLAGQGVAALHFGRTSVANEGLRRFKLGFGAREERLDYFKYDFNRRAFVQDVDRAETWMNHIFRRLPLPLLRYAGRMLYPNLS
jgi:hypothetical protein